MHVFLSPHLDDAILSCGGTIYQLTQSGEKVTIANVMAGDPPDPLPESPLIHELHNRWQIGDNPVAARRHEDEAAARLVGATSIHMDIPDCVYRTAGGTVLYPHGDDDLFGPIHPEDPARDILRQTTLPEISDLTHLYAPLGVGNHVDHQLVRDWARELIPDSPGVPLRFYADYPYSRNQAALHATLKTFEGPTLSEERVPLTPEAVERKITSVAEYQSQISTFWESLAEMREQILQSMKDTPGTYIERFWRLNTD